jgi:hypothetical protein
MAQALPGAGYPALTATNPAHSQVKFAVPVTVGTFWVPGASFGSFGAVACTGAVPVQPLAQVATPAVFTEIGPITAGVAVLHTLSQVLCDQSTGSGVTVTGAELNVPVAINWAVPSLATAGFGLIEIDSSTRLAPPPQLVTNNPQNKKENAPAWRSRYIRDLPQAICSLDRIMSPNVCDFPIVSYRDFPLRSIPRSYGVSLSGAMLPRAVISIKTSFST